MSRIRLVSLIACGLAWLTALSAPTPSQWEKPATALAEQIAGILGPGQAQLAIRNLSTIPAAELPGIRRLLEQDLKTHGVLVSGVESANAIRITLSESTRERLWVAEIVEGNETRTAMVQLALESARPPVTELRIVLRKEKYLGELDLAERSPADDPVLAVIETGGGLVVLGQQGVSIFTATSAGWKVLTKASPGQQRLLSRDPHGILRPTEGGNGFSAFVPGTACTGAFTRATNSNERLGDWSVRCSPSDDPWTLEQTDSGVSPLKAFYNTARNYFTGVVTPSLGVDLPPFYSAGLIPRAAGGAAILINGIDGKVQLVDNGVLRVVAGTRDWGSEFALLRSGCGAGTQVIASGSGEAASDSLRAYELPALEAVPVSGALAMEGTVTAMWMAPDAKSVFAVVRNAANEYEVDRVTAHCN